MINHWMGGTPASTEIVRAENNAFVADIRKARTSLEEILTENPGPWPGGQLMEKVMEKAGVRHDPAMYVEDEFICDGVLRCLSEGFVADSIRLEQLKQSRVS